MLLLLRAGRPGVGCCAPDSRAVVGVDGPPDSPDPVTDVPVPPVGRPTNRASWYKTTPATLTGYLGGNVPNGCVWGMPRDTAGCCDSRVHVPLLDEIQGTGVDDHAQLKSALVGCDVLCDPKRFLEATFLRSLEPLERQGLRKVTLCHSLWNDRGSGRFTLCLPGAGAISARRGRCLGPRQGAR